MTSEDRYDSLIQFYAWKYGLGWVRIKEQIRLESHFDPRARSKSGAMGLAQFMPYTWRWVWRDVAGVDPSSKDPYNPEEAIEACCLFMAYLYGRYDEIPDPDERYKFALAAYHTGRLNVNRALRLARKVCGAPESYAEWLASGRPAGAWQRWDVASQYLSMITGARAAETIRYVERFAP